MMTETSEAQERPVVYAPPPRWLTVPEVARVLSIGRERAYQLVGKEIPAKRFGPRRKRVSEEALQSGWTSRKITSRQRLTKYA
jgi:excisionase family DNA binding protein